MWKIIWYKIILMTCTIKRSERDYPFGKIAKMEAIMCICARRKVAHKSYAKSDAPMVGQCGEKTTRELLGKTIYWPKMKEDIEHYVRTCVKCQSTKSVHKKKFELYKPFLIPSGPFENISMDFMTCVP
jgi:hypothetical protein